MICSRYISLNIFRGCLLSLLVLISMSVFFLLISELDDIGKGQYGVWQLSQFMLLKLPSIIVSFMPLAVLLGTILSLGNLASSSELIAMQSSGMSVKRFVIVVAEAAMVIAVLTFIVSDFVVPISESTAKSIKSSSIKNQISIHSRKGVWIKDESNIIFIDRLFPNGNAKQVEISQMDENGELTATLSASNAINHADGWMLKNVRMSLFEEHKVSVMTKKQLLYKGNITSKLLESLSIDPALMSSRDLYTYIEFLAENKMHYSAESLSFWRKLYEPLIVIVMAVLAIPFVLGSQRNSTTGKRLITGIMLGLGYVVMSHLFIQLGEQLLIKPFINAFIPTFLFMTLTSYLIIKKTAG